MGGRRSNGEGTAYRYRDHKGRPRYRAQWTVPNPRDPDGPPQRRSKAGFETKRDALAFAADQLAAARQGTPAPGPAGGVTLAEHANAWLDGHRAAATTLADYRRKYRLHLAPCWAGLSSAGFANPRASPGSSKAAHPASASAARTPQPGGTSRDVPQCPAARVLPDADAPIDTRNARTDPPPTERACSLRLRQGGPQGAQALPHAAAA